MTNGFRLKSWQPSESQTLAAVVGFLEAKGAVNMTQVKGRTQKDYAMLWAAVAVGRCPIAWFFRNNVGGAWSKPEKGARFMFFGAPGSADLYCKMRDGQSLWIETKSPNGPSRLAQRVFKKACGEVGDYYLLARSVDDVVNFYSAFTDRSHENN